MPTTQEHFNQIINLIPEGEHYDRFYRGFEDGSLRIITKDAYGREYRYFAVFDEARNIVALERR